MISINLILATFAKGIKRSPPFFVVTLTAALICLLFLLLLFYDLLVIYIGYAPFPLKIYEESILM